MRLAGAGRQLHHDAAHPSAYRFIYPGDGVGLIRPQLDLLGQRLIGEAVVGHDDTSVTVGVDQTMAPAFSSWGIWLI